MDKKLKSQTENFIIMKINQKILAILILIITHSNLSYTQSIDSSFGDNGIVRTSFSTSFNSELQSAVLHSDGRISCVGFSGTTGFTSHILVSRYKSNGTPDSTFSGDGTTIFSYGGTNEQARSIIVLQNGNVLIGGGSSGKSAFAMIKPDGNLDAGFNSSGIMILNLGAGIGSRINKLIQLSDGKILGIGSAYNGFDFDMFACRINLNGSLDSSFAQNGIGFYPTGVYNNFGNDAALQSNGNIVIAGFSTSSSDYMTVIRLNTNGSIDSSFAINGRYHVSIGSSLNELNAINVLPNDDIVLAGSISGAPLSSINHITLKLKANGSTDNTFGNQGVVITDTRNTEDASYAIRVMSDGSILQSGFSYNLTGITEINAFRLKPNGILDSTFGINGHFLFPQGGTSWVKNLLLQPDGKLLLCGQSSSSLSAMADFFVLRFKSNVTTGIGKFDDHSLRIYPNPCSNVLHIENHDLNSADYLQFQILTLHGRIMASGLFNLKTEIALDLLPAGVYSLLLQKGTASKALKIIKQ